MLVVRFINGTTADLESVEQYRVHESPSGRHAWLVVTFKNSENIFRYPILNIIGWEYVI